jgi:hypothetical protein
MAGSDPRNSINQIDEYEAVLSQLSGQCVAVGRAPEMTSRVDEEIMIPRVLSLIQSTQNRVSEARLQSHRTITKSVSDTTTVGISYTDLRDHATGQRDFIVGAFDNFLTTTCSSPSAASAFANCVALSTQTESTSRGSCRTLRIPSVQTH